ncbi:predicted protein [Arabidopsis lyrata subsp. lyrata]|uniref:Predicted protein n=1 Tax=Arabidopsis lyrata subsp. lyrata TaxID=81972 RepID=D7MJA9_ARALL|nr:predicted protein [Arabidopsis lyrata subsp. lyrata]
MAGIDLPSDLVIDILARVPVKNLVRLLLRSKNFIKAQMTYAPRKILAIQDNGDSPPRSILFEQENNGKPKMTLKDADLTYRDDSLVDFDVIGHCDGVFCIWLQDRTLAVWNPLLRQIRKVSSKSTKPITSHDLIGTLAGNKIFWQVNNNPENVAESETILSFDLSSEKFEYKSVPRDIKGLIRGLVAVRGCLGFVGMYLFQTMHKIVVWTASNEKSWSKFTVKECFHDGFLGPQRNEVALLGTHKNKDEWKVKYLGHEAMEIFTYNLGGW